MTPKEKAQELIKKHLTAIAEETIDGEQIMNYNAKQCALVTINQILDLFTDLYNPNDCEFDQGRNRKYTFYHSYTDSMTGSDMVAYLEDVKLELEHS